MTKKKTDAPAPAFEPALERLETIVGEMESGTLSLEDMMSRFEEGQSLVKVCSEKLNQVERRIEILMKEGDKVVAKPFAEAESEPKDKDEDEEETGGTADGTPF